MERAKRKHIQKCVKECSAEQIMNRLFKIFWDTVKEDPDYVCTCCHRLMYRKTVVEFQRSKYKERLQEIVGLSLRRSVKQKVWICITCHRSLKQGRLPARAKANNLELEDIPAELSDLNVLEKRLVCLRIPFMKMVALPRGKQRAIHGPAVNVPTSLAPLCTLLPRLPSQVQLVPLKLKRRLSYRGHYMYDYVRPAKVLVALQWLMSNNPLYHDVLINTTWQDDAVQDDRDLLQAFLDKEFLDCPKNSSPMESDCLLDGNRQRNG